jgi:hypothetical protein
MAILCPILQSPRTEHDDRRNRVDRLVGQCNVDAGCDLRNLERALSLVSKQIRARHRARELFEVKAGPFSPTILARLRYAKSGLNLLMAWIRAGPAG